MDRPKRLDRYRVDERDGEKWVIWDLDQRRPSITEVNRAFHSELVGDFSDTEIFPSEDGEVLVLRLRPK